MERNLQKNGLINLLALLVVGVAGFAVARSSNALAGQVCIVFIGLGILVAATSWFQMRLEQRERLEKLELDELAKSRGGSALFETKEAELFPAQRSREQFERFFVPIFTALLCLAQAAGAWLLWSALSSSAVSTELKDPMLTLAMFGLFALLLFLLGKFSATMARLEEHRLLRPSASHLLLGAYLCFLVALGVIGVQAGFLKTDFYLGRVLCALLALIAVETLINLVLEIYRPRVKGKIERPLYESRLVGLLSQPEGLITTAAQALDYQFGFKVSETWFYRFLETRILWLVLPGAHLKWPWPFSKVYRFRTEQIQSFEIGTAPDPTREEGRTVLWTVAHTKEDNFLVANREQAPAQTTTNAVNKRTPPVSLITGTIPVQFQITNLLAWAYNNEDAPALLEDLATREVVRYLVGVDMNEIMSYGRLEAGQTLQQRIQAAANQRQLGARILSVGLQDLHPPVKVAPDYEKVVAAIHTRQAKILAAMADEIKTNALAGAQATNIINQASAESTAREIGAVARAALFTNQIPAFQAAPSVYAERAYLQAFLRGTKDARKYILLPTNTHDVLIFDLQEKISEGLLRATVPPPKTP